MMRKTVQKEQRIGQRLKDIRESVNCSRQALADALECSVTQIYKYERGTNRIAVTTLLSIAEVLNISVWDFIEDENGQLIDSQEQRALYYWRSLNHPQIQDGFIDLMQCVGGINPPLKNRRQV